MVLSRKPPKTLFVHFGTIILLCMLLFTACVNTKKSVYFPDIKNDTLRTSFSIPVSKIQSNDLLGITVSSPDPQATLMFNLTSTATSGPVSLPSTSTSSSGYLVTTEGYIKFPELGQIKVAGLTKQQLEEGITALLLKNKLLKDPIVVVRHLNFRVTVLGEVGRPSVINVPSEKISMLEAIGLAGDITAWGKRDNVLLIREDNGVKISRRFNLNSNELFDSEFYYLKSNDVIYVEPNKARVAGAGRGQQWVPIMLSSMALTVLILDLVIND